AIEACILWCLQFAWERPRPGEGAHAASTMIGTKVWLNAHKPRAGSLVWVWRLQGEGAYSLQFENGTWELTPGELSAPDVIVDTSAGQWAEFLTSAEDRKLPGPELILTGRRPALATFARVFQA